MTPEQQARDLLERLGVADAQERSAGDVGELAELIAKVGRLEHEQNLIEVDTRALGARLEAAIAAWAVEFGTVMPTPTYRVLVDRAKAALLEEVVERDRRWEELGSALEGIRAEVAALGDEGGQMGAYVGMLEREGIAFEFRDVEDQTGLLGDLGDLRAVVVEGHAHVFALEGRRLIATSCLAAALSPEAVMMRLEL